MRIGLRIPFDDFILNISYFLAFGFSIVMFYTFIVAYFNDYQARVLVNEYGEAHVEFIMLTFILMPLLVYGLYLRVRKKKDGVRRI